MTEDATRGPDSQGAEPPAQPSVEPGQPQLEVPGPASAPSAGAGAKPAPSPEAPSPEAPSPEPLPVEPLPVESVEAEEPTRRDVLAKAACALGACAFAGAGGVVGAAVVGTPLRGGESKTWWCPLGPAEEFPQGPRKLPVRAPGRDAWRRFADRSLGRVVVVKEGEDLRVYSAACPHNGCDVTVAEGGAELLCPCHHSRFALDGERIEGQSPRGLDPLETRVREGQLEVEWKRFALGTPDRKPV